MQILRFIIFNIILISSFFFIAYQVRLYSAKKQNIKKPSFLTWINQGTTTFKGVFVSLIFGIVFGFLDNYFLWVGIDKMNKFLPGGTLTKSALGNTYSDFIGATIGTAIASMGHDLFNVDNTPPIWVNAIGMVIGCLLGMWIGKITTGKS